MAMNDIAYFILLLVYSNPTVILGIIALCTQQ